jgi:carboxypeptidase Q
MRATLIAAALLFASPAPAAPQQAALDALEAAAAKDRLAFDLVTSITTEVGPRPAGSDAEARARSWAVLKLAALGFANVRMEEFPMTAWVRGKESARIVSPAPQGLVMAGLGRSVGTGPEGLEAEVVRFSSLDALKAAAPDSLAGKIAFIDGRVMRRSRLGEDAAEGYPRRLHGAAEAARKGAIAVLVRSAGSSRNRFAHTGSLRYQADAPRIPGAALAHADADQLARLTALGAPVRVRLTMGSQLVPGARSGNVIAELPGTDLAGEIVLLGAHIDSWDQGTGAIDDGVGIAIVIAAARHIADLPQRPRRTIRIVLFGSEELGLEGAVAYAKAHGDDRHVIATESDFGSAPVWGFYTGVPDALMPEIDRVALRLARLGIERGHNRASGGEDLGPLKQKGVPVASLVPDGTHYFDYHHTANDTLDKVDPAALQQNVQAFSIFAWMMANPPQ